MELQKNQIEVIKKALHETFIILEFIYPNEKLVFIDLAFDVLHGKLDEQQAGQVLSKYTLTVDPNKEFHERSVAKETQKETENHR